MEKSSGSKSAILDSTEGIGGSYAKIFVLLGDRIYFCYFRLRGEVSFLFFLLTDSYKKCIILC